MRTSTTLPIVRQLAALRALVEGLDLEGLGTGASAYEVAVANGFQGTEVQWLASLIGPQGAPGSPGSPGTDGKSAYQIARDHGYGGTETQWLATLVGEQGPQGQPGIQGDPGQQGIQGVPGTPGVGFTASAKVTTDQPFTSTTLSNVTGMSFAAAANTGYSFEYLLAITSAALTTGWQLGFTAPASPNAFVAVCEYQSSATAWTTATLAAPGAFTLVTAAYVITAPILVRIKGVLATAAGSGTLQLQARTEVASSAITVKRGSTLLVL